MGTTLPGPNFGTIVTSSEAFVPKFAGSSRLERKGGGTAMPSLAGYAGAEMTWMRSGVTA